MKDIRVVIGANYGDEGKGATVNWLLSEVKGKKAVVRFNGGAQAGHTVMSNRYRHVFSHYGSGTLDYIPTILTKDFVCSPHLFLKENQELIRKGVFRPSVYVSPRCPVTTPWDVMLNQMIEQKRGEGRHGSVGVGFGETIHRHETGKPIFQLTTGDLLNRDLTERKLISIFTRYVSERINQLGLVEPDLDDRQREFFFNGEAVAQKFLSEIDEFLKRVIILDESKAFKKFDSLVFEGAQGLALDQNNFLDFPHVTRSNTGLNNVVTALNEAGINDKFEVYYITRPYLTRHGAGPLLNETDGVHNYFNIVDETNRPHDFQGNLRFAYLDVDGLIKRILLDASIQEHEQRTKYRNIVFTCMQQARQRGAQFPVTIKGRVQRIDENLLMTVILDEINGAYVIRSTGEEYHHFNHYCANKKVVKEDPCA